MKLSVPLVLASASPRRRDLLAAAGLEFETLSPAITESSSTDLSLRELTTQNATRKAIAVAKLRPAATILGADTLVSLDGRSIGKPADMPEAVDILQRLNGREHQVCTAVYLCSPALRSSRSFYIITHVQFHSLTPRQVRAYLAKINPLDKAGAYAAQGEGREIIRSLRGSYTNVIGLPVKETLAALASYKIA